MSLTPVSTPLRCINTEVEELGYGIDCPLGGITHFAAILRYDYSDGTSIRYTFDFRDGTLRVLDSRRPPIHKIEFLRTADIPIEHLHATPRTGDTP